MSNRVANTVMLPVEEYEALKAEASDAASLRKKYADLCMQASSTPPEVETSVAKDAERYRLERLRYYHVRSKADHALGKPALSEAAFNAMYDATNDRLNGAIPSPLGTPLRTAVSKSEYKRVTALGGKIRPPKPRECENGCPPNQVCDHCQWTDAGFGPQGDR